MNMSGFAIISVVRTCVFVLVAGYDLGKDFWCAQFVFAFLRNFGEKRFLSLNMFAFN
jgi:hypothetical protein